MAEGSREVIIQRLTITSVNDHVNDLEDRLRRVEIQLGLREPDIEDEDE